MLILLDEVEVVNKRFFSGSLEGSSYFETLIHQLSNKTYAIIKIAIYPYSFEDIFKERGSRYGDIVKLGKNVMLNPEQYNTTIDEISWLIEKYINQVSNIRCNVQDVFEVSDDDKLLIEHLVNAANGNMRRLVELIASSMDIASKRHKREGRVTIEDVLTALKKQGEGMEEGLSGREIEKLEMLVRRCCSAKTNKFIFSQACNNNNIYMCGKGAYNIIQIIGVGNNRKYCFDYAYCVYKDIPTHFKKGTEQIDSTRSSLSGIPIEKVAVIEEYGRSREEKKLGEAVYGNNPSANADFESAVYTNRETIFGSEKKKDFNDKRIKKNNAGELEK